MAKAKRLWAVILGFLGISAASTAASDVLRHPAPQPADEAALQRLLEQQGEGSTLRSRHPAVNRLLENDQVAQSKGHDKTVFDREYDKAYDRETYTKTYEKTGPSK